eukprot:1966896-Pyramimonas_sp.AAC.1
MSLRCYAGVTQMLLRCYSDVTQMLLITGWRRRRCGSRPPTWALPTSSTSSAPPQPATRAPRGR